MARENESWIYGLVIMLVGRTSEMGSRALTHAAVGADAENLKGEYLSDCKLAK